MVFRAVEPANFIEGEKELLILARRWMPTLPFERIDLLIVDAIGKNISGSGMDTIVIGRKYNDHRAIEKEFPKVTRIFVRGLTEETHGNACGIGLAEFTHERLVSSTDREATYINCLTGNHPSAAQIPVHYSSDREVLEVALKTVGLVEPEDARVVRIHDTLDVEEILVSEAYEPEIGSRDNLSAVEGPAEMEFDDQGDLLSF